MDNKEEYLDPDYHAASGNNKKPAQEMSEEEKLEKIRNIIRREFGSEIEARENEVTTIDQRLLKARRLLHRLRYSLVNNYYAQERLQLTAGQLRDDLDAMAHVQAKPELSTLLREGQRRIHPSVRRLLGKGTVNLDEILKSRGPRNKTRKDYHAMVKSKNVTTPADATTSLRPVSTDTLEASLGTHTLEASVPEALADPAPSRPKKVPRHIEPKITSVFTIDEATRNKMKHRYRIIIGNTSKYAPPASRADRSTHKWLLYIRGPPQQPDISRVVAGATVRLHHSYAPHHTVHLRKPPFHVSRRGWGEFPAKIELHFAWPRRNRPATVEHTIKLDRNYTGLQTLGAETIVDVWLYSLPEMLEYEFSEDDRVMQEPDTTETQDTQTDTQTHDEVFEIKQEIIEIDEANHMDSWKEFFAKNTSEVNVDEMLVKTKTETDLTEQQTIPDSQIETEEMDFEDTAISNAETQNSNVKTEQVDKKRIVKYIEPNTGKIYYLEMDRNLDLSTVQEIIIDTEDGVKTAKISPMKGSGVNVKKPKKESLLKPEFRDLSSKKRKVKHFSHIQNDHCYVMKNDMREEPDGESDDDGECGLLHTIQAAVFRLTNVKTVVDYMLKKIPVISAEASKPYFSKHFPFVVESEERYWKMDFAKRRNIEWSRAKFINKTLQDRFGGNENVWRTKQVLIYSRLHGYNPIRTEVRQIEKQTEDWSSWNDLENSRKVETNIKELYPNPSDISTLTIFDSTPYLPFVNSDLVDLTDCEEEIDVVGVKSEVKKVLPAQDVSSLRVLPVEDAEDRLRFMYIERKCADIGIELRNEDVGNGCSYSAVHAVLLSAMKCFAEELLRSALAAKLTERRSLDYLPSVWVGSSSRSTLCLEHVYGGTRSPRLHVLTSRALAAVPRDTNQKL